MKTLFHAVLILALAFTAFIFGDNMGTRAQKDADQRDIDDAHHALVDAVALADACEAQEPMPEQKTR